MFFAIVKMTFGLLVQAICKTDFLLISILTCGLLCRLQWINIIVLYVSSFKVEYINEVCCCQNHSNIAPLHFSMHS